MTETIKLCAALNEAMKFRCMEHIESGEFCAAFELIEAGRAIEAGNADEAHQWLTDYMRDVP